MPGFIQNLLSDAAKTIKNEAKSAVKSFVTAEYLRDYTHASKTFTTNAYGYAPKYKFLFHVYFDINKAYIGATQNWPEDQNFGLTVKSIQLPKYSFELATMNQYNRKRVVQTKIKYDPIQISFHDDNSNLVRRLWYTYYTYYYKDATQADRNVYQGSSTAREITIGAGGNLNDRDIYENKLPSNDWGYIGESGKQPATATATGLGISKVPFFTGINIYGFNQHNFVMYRLVNPIIESFTHDSYNYAEGSGIMENQMTLQYESVKYYEGAVDGRTPDQWVPKFGSEANYDRTLSPIARPGSQGTILGQGGLVDGAGGILSDLESGNFLGAIQKAGTSYNTFKNPQTLLAAGKTELLSALKGAISGNGNRSGGFEFPTLNATTTEINSLIKKAVSSEPGPVSDVPIEDRSRPAED